MHKLARISIYLLVALGVISMMTSCDDNFIFETQGDCTPKYKVRFRYDWNLKFADAFSHEVGQVTLYLVDGDGSVVWSRHEGGPEVKAEGYMMDVNIEPGTYSLLAWAGEGHRTHFTIPEADRHDALRCTMRRDRGAEGLAESSIALEGLYHGFLADVVFSEGEGTHIVTMPLMKNTNDVTVVLQHLSGERVNSDKFRFEIETDNGLMEWDNTLLSDETIIYRPWKVTEGTAAIYPPEADKGSSRATESFSAAVANLSIARLVKERPVRLSVYNVETGSRVFSIPLIDYALLVKGKYGSMPDQEYLDRQDDYNMTFFLDDDDNWFSSYIYINSWKVLLQNAWF